MRDACSGAPPKATRGGHEPKKQRNTEAKTWHDKATHRDGHGHAFTDTRRTLLCKRARAATLLLGAKPP